MTDIDSIAVIVTYNRLDFLKEAVSKTLRQPFSSIIIVNNASTDETLSWLEGQGDERLIILNNAVNYGGSGGFYTALEWLSNNLVNHDPWVVLYDDDSFPHDAFLASLSRISSLYPNRKLFCSLVFDSDCNPVVMNTPVVKYPESFSENIKSLISRDFYALTDFSKPNDVMGCSFVGFVARKSVLVKNLESFPSAFFIYYDDVFYSSLLSRTFGKILFHPDLVFTHRVNFKKAQSIRPVWKTYFYTRNMFSFYKSISPRWYFLQIIPRIMYVLAMAFKDSSNRLAILNYLARGVYDGLRSNFDYNPLKAK